MKPPSVLIDASCFPEGPQRTSTLTEAEHAPELLPDGWLRFRVGSDWYRIPPWAVKRVTERREMLTSTDDKNIGKSIEVPYLVSKRKPKS